MFFGIFPKLESALEPTLGRQIGFNFDKPMRMGKSFDSGYGQILLTIPRPIQRLLLGISQMTIEDCGKEQKLSSSQAKVVEGHPWPRSPFLTNMPDQRELSSPSMLIGEQQIV